MYIRPIKRTFENIDGEKFFNRGESLYFLAHADVACVITFKGNAVFSYKFTFEDILIRGKAEENRTSVKMENLRIEDPSNFSASTIGRALKLGEVKIQRWLNPPIGVVKIEDAKYGEDMSFEEFLDDLTRNWPEERKRLTFKFADDIGEEIEKTWKPFFITTEYLKSQHEDETPDYSKY